MLVVLTITFIFCDSFYNLINWVVLVMSVGLAVMDYVFFVGNCAYIFIYLKKEK